MAVQKGDTAPDFTLYNTDKEAVTLSDQQGKKNVVLLFFPMAFTGVCTEELCNVRDNIPVYSNDNTEVYGISVDSPFTLENFKKQQNYNFSLLSDFNKTASTAYDSVYDTFTGMDLQGVSKRSAFVIDKKGVIQYAEVLESAGDQPNFDKIKETLNSLEA